MFNTLKNTFKINISYSINSYIYTLKSLPILKDLFTDDIYKSTLIKKIVSLFVILFSFIKSLFLKFLYFFVILIISYKLFPNNLIKSFFHIYFTLTLLGIFINNKLLRTNKKKYFSIILFNMDATEFFKANLLFNSISNLILNSLCLSFFCYLLKCPFYISIILVIFTMFVRFTGEALNIIFYKKYKYIWYSNTYFYFGILTFFFLLCLLPFIKIYFSFKFIYLVTLIFIILGIISLIYLLNLKDYKLLYKRLSNVTKIMDSKNEKDYLKQAMVSINKKDKFIDNKKLKNKKGYDLFNTIFFERHKEILLRSAKKYSFICLIIYLIVFYLVIKDNEFSSQINYFLNNNFSWFVIIMFFINRGAIITQAMFFNCDHAMLQYNFYKEPKTILELFKKRLLTIVKVNLIPAIIIASGNVFILLLTNNHSFLTYIGIFTSIIFLSIFSSVHYLVIYYLFQPFNNNMEVKKTSYSFITIATYLISYMLTDLVMDTLLFSYICIIITLFYIIISLILIKLFAPRTFKLSND